MPVLRGDVTSPGNPTAGCVMIFRLSNFSIAQKIAFACLVPLIGLTIFAGVTVIEARQKASAADEVLAATALAEGASLAVHELQRERGMSVGFVASKGANFAAELPKQREETDRRLKALHDAVGSAGEVGLFQVMPSTAALFEKSLGKFRRPVMTKTTRDLQVNNRRV